MSLRLLLRQQCVLPMRKLWRPGYALQQRSKLQLQLTLLQTHFQHHLCLVFSSVVPHLKASLALVLRAPPSLPLMGLGAAHTTAAVSYCCLPDLELVAAPWSGQEGTAWWLHRTAHVQFNVSIG